MVCIEEMGIRTILTEALAIVCKSCKLRAAQYRTTNSRAGVIKVRAKIQIVILIVPVANVFVYLYRK